MSSTSSVWILLKHSSPCPNFDKISVQFSASSPYYSFLVSVFQSVHNNKWNKRFHFIFSFRTRKWKFHWSHLRNEKKVTLGSRITAPWTRVQGGYGKAVWKARNGRWWWSWGKYITQEKIALDLTYGKYFELCTLHLKFGLRNYLNCVRNRSNGREIIFLDGLIKILHQRICQWNINY